MAAVLPLRLRTSTLQPRQLPLLPLLAVLLSAISLSHAANCPHPCHCRDGANATLTVMCAHKYMTSPPASPGETVTLDVSNNSLGPVINSSFPRMAALTSLDLSHNGLVRLLGCTLTGMLSLRRLSLRGNRLTSLPDAIFSDTAQLETLDLSHNALAEIPDAPLRHVARLASLDLSHNRLVDLHLGPRFQVTRLLNHLDLSHNLFTSIGQDAFKTTSRWDPLATRTLRLAHCNLTSIAADAFQTIPRLGELDISWNEFLSLGNLTSVVKELETRGLKRLSMSGNNISTLRPFFSQVTRLSIHFLNASHNAISDLPRGTFTTVQSLKYLDLSHNIMTSLSKGFADLPNLRMLNLSHNRLTDFRQDPASTLTKLQVLDVSNNRLRGGPGHVHFSSLTRLAHLDVSNNLMTSVMLPGNTSRLEFLDYHANAVTTFGGISNASRLEYFDISDNDLENVTSFLLRQTRVLKLVNLSRNSVTRLDHRAFLPHSPLVLDLSHNFLSHVQYSNWIATQELLLNDNEIKTIDSQAFYGMTGLRVLDLSRNKLAEVHEQLLQYLTALERLDLSHNSLTRARWFTLFKHLELLQTLDLSHNNISSLSKDMFLPVPKLTKLLLNRNNIQTIFPITFRDLGHLKQLDLSDNPLSCTCDLLAFRDWVTRSQAPIARLYAANSTAYTCHSPAERAGVHVGDWSPHQLECDQSLLYLVIFGSVGAFLAVAGVVATATYRMYKVLKARRKERLKLELLEGRHGKTKKLPRRHREYELDGVVLTSHEIAEEIKEAAKRKEFERQRSDNGYVPFPGDVRRHSGHLERLSDQEWTEKRVGQHRGHHERFPDLEWVEKREVEQLARQAREDSAVYVDAEDLGQSKRHRERTRSEAELDKCRKDEKNAADRKRRSMEKGEQKASDRKRRSMERGEKTDSKEKRRDKSPDKGRRGVTSEHERGRDGGRHQDRSRQVEQSVGRTRHDFMRASGYRGETSQRPYSYGPEPWVRSRSPRRSVPYMIASPQRTSPEMVEVWRQPRGWTLQGPRGRRPIILHERRRERDGYFTLPVNHGMRPHGGGVVVRRPALRAPLHHADRPPAGEVRFRDEHPRAGHLGQDERIYFRPARPDYTSEMSRGRSKSYQYLPSDPDDPPRRTQRSPSPDPYQRGAHRQYESIEPRRESILVHRAASQPFLAQEVGSAWL